MKHFLVVVDLQKDFVSGALSNARAQAFLESAAEYIRNFEGEIFVTLDTHNKDYLNSAEGKMLPVEHCIKGTEGWQLEDLIAAALESKAYTLVEKPTFGSVRLPELIGEKAGTEEFSIELFGVCTDICVVSNALLLKAHFPSAEISVRSQFCAGVTEESHESALVTMQSCQIQVL